MTTKHVHAVECSQCEMLMDIKYRRNECDLYIISVDPCFFCSPQEEVIDENKIIVVKHIMQNAETGEQLSESYETILQSELKKE